MASKSTVNAAGNYTKPTMRKALFQKIKAGTKGGEPTRLLLSLRAWGASSKADAQEKARKISARNKAKK